MNRSSPDIADVLADVTGQPSEVFERSGPVTEFSAAEIKQMLVREIHNHARFQDDGLEQCPICGTVLGGRCGHLGPVFDHHGERFETLYATDPTDGPFYCSVACANKVASALSRVESESLAAFGGDDDER